MTLGQWKRWWPVALYFGSALAIGLFAFVPFHRQAETQSRRASELSRELDLRIEIIESLPAKQEDLRKLALDLSRFKSSLSTTDQADQVMKRFRSRAEASGLELWILNPSVPVLIRLDAGGDSLARLDLAVLPVVFECRGSFRKLASFLESEESRSDFYRWQTLSCSAQPAGELVHARGEIELLLLPTAPLREASL